MVNALSHPARLVPETAPDAVVLPIPDVTKSRRYAVAPIPVATLKRSFIGIAARDLALVVEAFARNACVVSPPVAPRKSSAAV